MPIISLKKRKRRKKRRHPVRIKKRPTPKSKPKPKPPAATVPAYHSAALVATSRERLYLNRFGTGFTQSALTSLRSIGTPETWLESQLAPESVSESAKVAELDGWFDFLWRTPSEKAATNSAKTKTSGAYAYDLGNWSILRRIYSERSVLETMSDFWSTNLHIPAAHDRAWVYRFDYDATIRDNALGRFEDLLIACSLHPAMRVYLDNWSSVKDKPNENQGRELLEVHTVGRTANYTEAMVKASAILLSGYTVDWGKSFDARYDPSKHTTGTAQVLAFNNANGQADGQAATLAYLKYLANHDETARNLARKIATYFVSDNPSLSLVDALAGVYLASGTDIKAVLRALAVHPEFLTSEGQKVRTPAEDLVATARVLNVDIHPPTGATSDYCASANYVHGGPPLFSWPRPDGPPVSGLLWSSASRVFASCKMHMDHAGGWWPKGATYRAPASWLPAPTLRFDAYVDHLCKSWLGRPSDARLLKAAEQGVGLNAETVITPKHALATSPWWMSKLIVALLDTPEHMTT